MSKYTPYLFQESNQWAINDMYTISKKSDTYFLQIFKQMLSLYLENNENYVSSYEIVNNHKDQRLVTNRIISKERFIKLDQIMQEYGNNIVGMSIPREFNIQSLIIYFFQNFLISTQKVLNWLSNGDMSILNQETIETVIRTCAASIIMHEWRHSFQDEWKRKNLTSKFVIYCSMYESNEYDYMDKPSEIDAYGFGNQVLEQAFHIKGPGNMFSNFNSLYGHIIKSYENKEKYYYGNPYIECYEEAEQLVKEGKLKNDYIDAYVHNRVQLDSKDRDAIMLPENGYLYNIEESVKTMDKLFTPIGKNTKDMVNFMTKLTKTAQHQTPIKEDSISDKLMYLSEDSVQFKVLNEEMKNNIKIKKIESVIAKEISKDDDMFKQGVRCHPYFDWMFKEKPPKIV